MHSGTIYEDGRVVLHGCTPEKTRLVAITSTMIAIHHPSGTYWDNGGENYVRSWIEVEELEELKPGNEPGSWVFRTKRMSPYTMSFHPVVSRAAEDAMFKLERDGARISQHLHKKNWGDEV